MIEKNDWRLTNQQNYLHGVILFWRKWTGPSERWDHDHCDFCWTKFMEVDSPEVLHEGYTTQERDRWVCRDCYEDFKEMFAWKLGE
jgi:hypothetical protein